MGDVSPYPTLYDTEEDYQNAAEGIFKGLYGSYGKPDLSSYGYKDVDWEEAEEAALPSGAPSVSTIMRPTATNGATDNTEVSNENGLPLLNDG